MTTNTIHLTENLLLGRGAHRECYQHPTNMNLCVKVVYNLSNGGEKELRRELSYYNKLNSKIKDWSSITRYYGKVKTNIGTGYLYDQVRNKDGSPSITLRDYLNNNPVSEQLKKSLVDLKEYIGKNRLSTMTIKQQNILCQIGDGNTIKLVIVDNLGESTLIPLSKVSKTIFNLRLNKKWRNFIATIEKN